jgi:glycosyltransferase involved in cell wall biosynthesis
MPAPMARVLLLALRFWPATGGVEARTWEVARRLAKQHDVTVLTTDLRQERPFQRFAPGEVPSEAEGVRIVRLRAQRVLPVEGYGVWMAGLRPALREAFRAAEVLDAHPYGAAHTDLAVRLARRSKVGVALTAHFHPASSAQHRGLRALYDRVRGGPTLRMADKVVAVAPPEAEALRRDFHLPGERIATIPNGLDTRHFRDLGQPRDPHLLLAVGRLAPVKGFDLALEALGLLRQQGFPAKLLLAGEDWGEGPALQAKARDLGIAEAVEFAGRVDGVRLLALYNRASLFLMPSRYEAFGIAALEAIASGCPALGSDAGGIPAAIGPGGKVLPRDAQAWAGAIRGLLQDPSALRALRKAGRAHAEAHDWDAIATQVGALWQWLAEARR